MHLQPATSAVTASTRYDESPAQGRDGEPHPLAGVPQAARDAAQGALTEAD